VTTHKLIALRVSQINGIAVQCSAVPRWSRHAPPVRRAMTASNSIWRMFAAFIHHRMSVSVGMSNSVC
jgi:hypothetical protein